MCFRGQRRQDCSRRVYVLAMKIVWNQVTWYSKLLAVILFVFVIPALTFYIGMQYGEISQQQAQSSS